MKVKFLNFNSPPEQQFLGAFAELRKATINFVMSVCLIMRTFFSQIAQFLRQLTKNMV